MKRNINVTEMINIDDMDKIVPVACSWCDKIYYLKKWKMEEGKSTGMLRGVCPECEEKQKLEEEEEKAKNN
jgi:hypothetical protein